MEFIELAKRRYSCRSYKNKDVEEDKLYKILEAVRVSPSACNLQPRHFIVVKDKTLKQKIAEAYPRSWFSEATIIIVACGDHSQSWKRQDGKDHCDIDTAIAIDHLTLAAAEQGLATCWICAFDTKICRKALNLPDYIEPIALIPLGYPADSCIPDRHATRRKSFDDFVHNDGFRV